MIIFILTIVQMELKDCQHDVIKYFEELETKRGLKPWPRFVVLARLEEELSEIGRIISVEEGYREKSKVDNMNSVDEFGDALFELVHLANLSNVDLEESWKYILKKYSKYLNNSKNIKD